MKRKIKQERQENQEQTVINKNDENFKNTDNLFEQLKNNKSLFEIFNKEFKDPTQYNAQTLKEVNVILEKTGLISFLPVNEIMYLDDNEDKNYNFTFDENSNKLLNSSLQNETQDLLCYYYDKYMRKEHIDYFNNLNNLDNLKNA